MKIAIFCGGHGQRFWPLSRVKKPKQLDPIFGGKSTFQLTLSRLGKRYNNPRKIIIATSAKYKKFVSKQAPRIPKKNIILEPTLQDLGPAVGLVTAVLEKEAPYEPFAILWSDHLMKRPRPFREMLRIAEEEISRNKNSIIFFGQPASFPSENWGWIKLGGEIKRNNGVASFRYRGWEYRPKKKLAKKLFRERDKNVWNLGYFATTPSFLLKQYKKLAPQMYKKLKRIQKDWRTKNQDKTLKKVYPTLKKISFDDLIVKKIPKNSAKVLVANPKWMDVGNLYALKEALTAGKKENYKRGLVFIDGCQDSIFYNKNRQLVVGLGLDGFIVANTPDTLLVCHKDQIPRIKDLLKKFKGTALEKYT